MALQEEMSQVKWFWRSQHGIKETTQLKDEAWLSVLIQGKKFLDIKQNSL